MTQYFTDFSEYTTGVQPSDWTRRWVTTGWATTVVDDAAATGGKVFRLNPDGSNSRKFISWDEIDADANRDNVEVYVRFTVHSSLASYRELHTMTRGSGAAASESGYRMGASSTDPQRFDIAKYVSGTFTNINQNSVPIADGETWHIRARANSTALKIRWWKDGAEEPVAWSDERTDSSLSSAGWVGLNIFQSNAAAYADVDVFSVGTNGDTAPTEAPATGPTITNVPNMTIGIQATITGTGLGT